MDLFQNRCTRTGLYDQFKELRQRASVTRPINCHNFRHSRTTDFARRLKSEQKLKLILGWAPKSSQAATYIHLTGEDISDAMLEAT
jgi:integrase